MALTRAEISANFRARRSPEQRQKDIDSKAKWRASNPDRHLQHSLTPYKLTVEAYDTMLLDQDYKCALCSKEIFRANSGYSLEECACVDHCHDSLVVRGLLCRRCNLGLGNFNDNKETLMKAIAYLEASGVTI